MFTMLFGDVGYGRIGRLSFLFWSILTALIWVIIAIIIADAMPIDVPVIEHLVSSDDHFVMAAAQYQTRGQIHPDQAMKVLLLSLILTISTFSFIFASLNISAKRVRDIGLPGWSVALGVYVVAFALTLIGAAPIAHFINLLFFFLLVLWPGDPFQRLHYSLDY